MKLEETSGYAQAVTLVNKRMSPRAHRLARLERFVEGTQYEGLRDWDDDVPIVQKAPCIVEPIVNDSIESHVDMVGFPEITSRPAEDDSEELEAEGKLGETTSEGDADEGGLDESESEALDALIKGVHESVRFPALCREALALALGVGTSCAVYGAVDGRLHGETIKARWCEPELAQNGRTVERLVIEYPYIDAYQERSEWKCRARVYRRVIDSQADTTYKPIDAEQTTAKWEADPALTFQHALGFCPVIWYPLLRGCTIVGVVDGNAPHQNLLDETRAHDVALSQRHRAALYAGDPQWTECGVDPGTNPSESVKASPILVTEKGGPPSADNPVLSTVPTGPQTGGTARKKHPGTIWQYESPDTQVKLHTLPGEALTAITDHAHDLRLKLMQALAYVPLDPESVKFSSALSGKALQALRLRQTNRDSKIREDFGDWFIKPSLSMLLRICHVKGASLRVKGLTGATKVLGRFAGGEEPTRAVA